MRNPFRVFTREDDPYNSPSADTRKLDSARNPIPARLNRNLVTIDDAMTLSMVYRAHQILVVSGKQLPLHTYRNETKLENSNLIEQPDPDISRSRWIEQIIMSLAGDGNAFIEKIYYPGTASVAALKVLNPLLMTAGELTADGNVKTYNYNGRTIMPFDLIHIPFMLVPGHWRGLSPTGAAQIELAGTLELRDYAETWLDASGVPLGGHLSTDQPIDDEIAETIHDRWMEVNGAKKGIAVTGYGFKYSNVYMSPKEIQWLESQQFNITQIARLYGIPSSLMLAEVQGGSETYKNIEQDWLGFTRFTLMSYLLPIEEELSKFTPRGQYVKFNIDALLRTDTLTRYQAHAIATGGKAWLDEDEVRALENRPPLTDIQREKMQATAPAVKPIEENIEDDSANKTSV